MQRGWCLCAHTALRSAVFAHARCLVACVRRALCNPLCGRVRAVSLQKLQVSPELLHHPTDPHPRADFWILSKTGVCVRVSTIKPIQKSRTNVYKAASGRRQRASGALDTGVPAFLRLVTVHFSCMQRGQCLRAHTTLWAPTLLMLAVWFLAWGGRCAIRRAGECGRLATRN